MTNSPQPARHISNSMEVMNNSLEGIKAIKRFTIRVGKTLVHFSHKGVRVPSRYRLQLINDSHMSTLWSVSGGRGRMLLLAIILFFIITISGAALLGMTPLRTILPGYLKRSQRHEMTDMSARVDSLSRLAAVNNRYLDNLVAILNDEIDIDSIRQAYTDSINRLHLPVDSLSGTSNAEREFARRYEQRERFNVSVLSPVVAEGMVFYPAVKSPITTASEPSGRVSYQLSPSSPVSAIYRGTVIDSHYVPGEGYTMVIQHPHDFISRYTGIAEPMVGQGAKVNTGARIGLSSNTRADDRPPLTLEMWFNGSQLDPTEYID